MKKPCLNRMKQESEKLCIGDIKGGAFVMRLFLVIIKS